MPRVLGLDGLFGSGRHRGGKDGGTLRAAVGSPRGQGRLDGSVTNADIAGKAGEVSCENRLTRAVNLGLPTALSSKEQDVLDVPPLQCRQCLHKGEPWLLWQQFSNKTIHLRAECRGCGAFVQYVPQIEPWIDAIEPWAEEPSLL